MTDSQIENCPICYDDFNFPKILACRHTYCLACLEEYHSRTKSEYKTEAIRCPLCQTLCALPPEGLKQLLTNFFVSDCLDEKSRHWVKRRKIKKRSVVWAKGRDDTDDSTDDEEQLNENSRDDIPDEPWQLAAINASRAKATMLVATQAREYIVPFTRSDTNDGMVTELSPLTTNECLAVVGASKTVNRLDPRTSTTTTQFLFRDVQRVYAIKERRDGSFFVLAPAEFACLVVRDKHKSVHIKVNEAFSLIDMDVFPDEKLVMIAHEQGNQTRGVVMIFNKDGSKRNFLTCDGDFNLLRVAVNPVTEFIFLTDNVARNVKVILTDGHLINEFRGFQTALDFIKLPPILPLDICCDQEGNVYLVDGESKCIFLLTSYGECTGIIVPSNNRGFGDPNVLKCTSDGSLWIGDMQNGRVCRYQISTFVNKFGLEGLL